MFKYTNDELMKSILKDEYKFPITSSKNNLMNKKIDYKVLMLMTLLSNRQTEESFTESGMDEIWRYLYRNKLTEYQDLVEGISNNKLNSIFKAIKKMEKLDCNVINVKKTEGNEIVYYINYTNNGREYVTIETKIMEALISSFNSNAIKVYILLKYMCRNGKKKITQKWIAEQIGLSTKSNDNYATITNITDLLSCYGLINKETISVSDAKTICYYNINSVEEWENIRNNNMKRATS